MKQFEGAGWRVPHRADARAKAAWGHAATVSLRPIGLFVFLALFCALTARIDAAETKRVLIVHSFGSAAPPFTVHSLAFQTALIEKLGQRVDLDEVSLDMARYFDNDMQEAIVQYLQRRQAKWQPDLVVPIGSPAAVFVAKYRESLFPNTPVLYTSLDRRLLPPNALEKNAAYIGQEFNIAELIEDMLRIAPATKNVAVVIGASPLEQYWTEAFRKAADPFKDRINFIYLNDVPFDQILSQAGRLPANTFIFLLLLLRDAAGVTHNADEALQQLHAVANAPINGIFEHELGLGIVGGHLYQGARIGHDAAEIAVRILNGEPASSFPPKMVPPLPPRYDWRELQRWKINERNLPPGSTVAFRTPTFWEEDKGWIILGTSIFAVQALLILGLIANSIKRRRAEGSLAESEKRFRTMADAAPVLIWMAGPDKACIFFNKSWLRFTGRKMADELGNGWAEGVHAEDLNKCLRTYHGAFDSAEPFTMQYRLRRHDGEYRWITDEGVPRYNANGKFAGYIGACVDITDLLRQKRALHDFEQRAALAADAANLGVWEFDPERKSLWVSDKLRSLFRFDPIEKISYEEFQARVHPDDRAARDAAINRAIESQGAYENEYRVLLPDGTLRWIAGRARCLTDDDGKSCLLVGVSIDITERKEAAEESRRRRQQTERLGRVSLLGEMSASLAHELNQPLSAIVSNANAGMRFIDRGRFDATQIREILSDVVEDGRRANQIITNVRNMIKKGAAIRAPINLNDVVRSVAHMLQPDAQSHACEVDVSLGEHVAPVEGDPVQIQQALINLVSNAFDAMRDTPPDKRRVQITTQNGNDKVCVAVRDHGPGLPAERDRLFEQFFSTKEEGLGLGLAIVRSIIEAHGGRIEAENVDDGGARFYFQLPVANAK